MPSLEKAGSPYHKGEPDNPGQVLRKAPKEKHTHILFIFVLTSQWQFATPPSSSSPTPAKGIMKTPVTFESTTPGLQDQCYHPRAMELATWKPLLKDALKVTHKSETKRTFIKYFVLLINNTEENATNREMCICIPKAKPN